MKNQTQIRQSEALQKAAVLAEALPWLLKFQDSIVVIKFGGNAMTSEELSKQFAEDVVFLKLAGLRPVVVHGGGPQISKRLEESGIKSEFVSGYRVTNSESIKIVRDVLVDLIQKELVSNINGLENLAVGLAGDTNFLIEADKLLIKDNNIETDIGLVGSVTKIDADQIIEVLDSGKIPVISTIGIDKHKNIYNINADTAAAAIASALNAQKLVILTDVAGLMEKYPDPSTVIPTIEIENLKRILPTLDEGMKPKMQACLDAVQSGVQRAHVIDGRAPHAVLVEVFTDSGTGTMIVKNLDNK
jgi:acetylglutamate kinase